MTTFDRLADLVRRVPGGGRTFGAAAILLLAALPWLVQNDAVLDILTVAGLYVTLALSLNVIVGYAGLLNLGHAAFYAVGAYTYALLASPQHGIHISPWLLFPLSGLTAGAAGFCLGLPVLRLGGDYLAIVTLGFGEIARITLNNLGSFTNGPNGIANVDHPSLFGRDFGVEGAPYFWLVWTLAVLAILAMRRLEDSRIGRAWKAIREDELAAAAQGIPVTRLKLQAFALGAGLAGVCGACYAAKQGHVAPESFTFMESVTMLAMVVLGGLGTVAGPVVGAVTLSVLPFLLLGFETWRMLLFGAALVVMMLLRPQGLLGRRGGLAA
ncbi:MAG: ABC transporter ATP-binding protein [Candidatus Coatesbacteria bacterium]